MSFFWTVSPPEVWVDFNRQNDDGTYTALLSRLSGFVPATEGQWVNMRDNEGHSLWGSVCRILPDRLIVSPVWSSWVRLP
jgi:hypothetical protein